MVLAGAHESLTNTRPEMSGFQMLYGPRPVWNQMHLKTRPFGNGTQMDNSNPGLSGIWMFTVFSPVFMSF